MNKKVIIVAGLTAVLAGFGVQNAYAADATGTGNAVIAVPIGISATNDMEFGSVIASAAAGTVVISTANARSVTGGVTELGGLEEAATFAVSGEPSASYTISFSSGDTLTGTGTPMAIGSFTNTSTGVLDGSGDEAVSVGATLSVAASQTAGAYTGSFTVTVDYP